jgi:hypothetical protein
MPQNPVMVYAKEDGTPCYMHTVDAAEAVRLGDYTPAPPGGKDVEPEARASAMSRFRTGQGATHPELQTEEEREESRAKANEQAELMAGVPEGAQVVVMAPSKADAPTARSTARSHQATTSSPPPPATPPASRRSE